ncbi:D-hexose-6-phosphate mutarotase [Serinicoccus kebangsaanensis]|uniref:D-hexose-6-phosphate mutarotase n=1 Tax=Serinicoccus kebangsaanensis TaxID=2602069 RepID=UPI00124EF6F6|nr:D-hexose-6-phosphate mutarotase [Serinicoccus kebangsaanensis]
MPPAAPLTARTAERGGSALVAYDHGAHLARWDVGGAPVVWCSDHAVLDGSRAIRGGVPLCFPWFADGPSGALAPAHGLVRTTTWTPLTPAGHETWAWTVSDTDVAGHPGAEHLGGPFALRYAVSLEPRQAQPVLRLSLAVHNPGSRPLRAEVALHTYLAVGDVTRTQVRGLSGADYLDKVTGERLTHHGPVLIEGETDSVFDSPGRPRLEVDDGERVLVLTSEGAGQTVVWNPGADKAAGMSDLGDGEWRDFVCVEAAATGDLAVEIDAGATHTLGCAIAVQT